MIYENGYTASIVTIMGSPRAVILVSDAETNPTPGAAIIHDAQRYFPTMPIMLISPRVDGFSRTFALWDTSSLGRDLDTRALDWRHFDLPPEPELPF